MFTVRSVGVISWTGVGIGVTGVGVGGVPVTVGGAVAVTTGVGVLVRGLRVGVEGQVGSGVRVSVGVRRGVGVCAGSSQPCVVGAALIHASASASARMMKDRFAGRMTDLMALVSAK
jgi:hypothetical protein